MAYHQFNEDDLYVAAGQYAWVYQRKTTNNQIVGSLKRKPEYLKQNGKLLPSFPKENPALVKLSDDTIVKKQAYIDDNEIEYLTDAQQNDIDNIIMTNAYDVVLEWKNIVAYQRKRGSRIKASEETMKRRIVEFKVKNIHHVSQRTIPHRGIDFGEFSRFMNGYFEEEDEKDLVREWMPGFDCASAEDCVRALNYTKCGCNVDGKALTLRFGGQDDIQAEQQEQQEQQEQKEEERQQRAFVRQDEEEVTDERALNEINAILNLPGQRPTNPDEALDALDGMMDRLNLVEESSDDETFEAPATRIAPIGNVIVEESSDDETFEAPATHIAPIGNNVVEESSDDETFEAPATHIAPIGIEAQTSDEESFAAPAVYAQTSDEESFAAPAAYAVTSDEESEAIPTSAYASTSEPSHASVYATTSEDEFSAPAGQLSEAESEEFSAPAGQLSEAESEDIGSAMLATTSDASAMYASTSETEDEVSTAELGWESTQPSSSMYVSSSDQGDDLMSLTQDM